MTDSTTPHVRVAILGSGFAGLCMAMGLKRSGMDDFLVLERDCDVGGTWRDNTYPGCACDVPSNLYCFSFEPNPDWSRAFCGQPEIQSYLRRCVSRYRLGPHLRFHHEVRSALWDEAAGHWLLATSRGLLTADVVICGTGPLSEPSTPSLPGLDRFAGTTFHSSRWDHSYDLSGERVAVLGTGASSAQFVPEIQPQVSALYVFQRTAPWVIPRLDRTKSRFEQLVFSLVPALQRFARAAVYWGRETFVLGLVGDHRLLKIAECLARLHLRRQVDDPELRAALVPDYAIGCKRLIMSSSYYPALCQPNVDLVTEKISEVRPHSLVTADGTERPVDSIIFGTGFQPAHLPLASRLFGSGGQDLAQAWSDGARAYLGMTVAGFPNMFLLVGPNSVLGHNSVILAIEAQVRYVVDALRFMRAREVAVVEVRAAVEEEYVDDLQDRMRDTIWVSGCRSWYLDDQGRNTTLWPDFTRAFERRTRRFDPSSYRLSPRRPGRPGRAARRRAKWSG